MSGGYFTIDILLQTGYTDLSRMIDCLGACFRTITKNGSIRAPFLVL